MRRELAPPRWRGSTRAAPALRYVRTAPPRWRGSTPDAQHARPPQQGSPALAGVHPSRTSRSRWSTGLPRAGGGPTPCKPCVAQGVRAPPRWRGSTRTGAGAERRDRGSPALAGVHPRLRRRAAPRRGSPALAGVHPRNLRRARRGPGSPALAGVHPEVAREEGPSPGLPRAGGGPPIKLAFGGNVVRAPPRWRGSTLVQRAREDVRPRLPRAGGGPPCAGVETVCAVGSPARGGGPPRLTHRR